MSGMSGHRTLITTEDWMRDMEKRTLHDYRRPQIRTASDLMGPGLGPRAIELRDWNDEATTFNGFFYSTPGAQNTPDTTRYWMGYVVANEFGAGYMLVYEYALDPTVATVPVRTYLRNFQTIPGSLRSFGAWVPMTAVPTAQGIVPGGYNEMFTSSPAATSGTYIDTGNAVTVTLSSLRRYMITAQAQIQSTAAADRMGVQILDGATQLVLVGAATAPLAGVGVSFGVNRMLNGPTSGTRTIKVQIAKAGSGNVTWVGNPITPAWLSIEDAGPL